MKKATALGIVVSACAAACGNGKGELVENTNSQKATEKASELSVSSRMKGEPIAPQVDGDWVGHDLGASPGVWHSLGRLEVARREEGDTSEASGIVGLEDETAAPDTGTVIIANFETDTAYEVYNDPADLAVIARELERRGYNSPSSGDVPVEANSADDWTSKSWSDDVDNRTPRGIYEYGTSSYAKLGQLYYGVFPYCSATLIGAGAAGYYVITAAHCLFDQSTGNWAWLTFRPRQDGCRQPNGDPMANCDETPYGTWSMLGAMVPGYFYYYCRPTGSGRACLSQDIAIMKVQKPQGEVDPGTMGFNYYTKDYLLTKSVYLRGYPNCGGDGDPQTNCRDYTLYGQPLACALGDESYADGDGWSRLMRHGCDTSEGMSGSSLYWTAAYGAASYVAGVHTGSYIPECWTQWCGPVPNALRRITPMWYSQMLSFMGL